MALRELLLVLGVEVDKNGVKKADAALGKIKKAGVALVAIFVTGKIAKGITGIIELGSAADETSNVIQASFKESADSVEEWASRQAKAMGRSRFELREMAASTGAIIAPTLGSASAAAEMATQVAQLAVDLGSFFNANDEDALASLQAGLIGSAEPMLKFGVTMNVAALEAFSLEKNMGKTFKAMSAGEQQQLRFNFIMDKTVNAQGDAAKTALGYANASKALMATVKDMATLIGMKLVPAAEKLIQVLIPLVKVIGEGLLIAFDVLGNVIGGIIDVIEIVIGVLGELDNIFDVVTVAIGALSLAMVLMGKASVIAARKTMISWLKAAFPFVMMAALIVGVLLLIDDLVVFFKGGDSLIGRFIDGFRKWVKEMGGFSNAVGRIFEILFSDLFGMSEDTSRFIGAVFAALVASVKWFFTTMPEWIGEKLAQAFIFVQKFSEDFMGAMGDAIDWVVNKFGEITDLVADAIEFVVGKESLIEKAKRIQRQHESEEVFRGRKDKADKDFQNRVAILKKMSKEGFGTLTQTAESGTKFASASLSGATAGAQQRFQQLSQNINAPLTVNVDASGASSPSEIGEVVASKVSRTQESRQYKNAFVTERQ